MNNAKRMGLNAMGAGVGRPAQRPSAATLIAHAVYARTHRTRRGLATPAATTLRCTGVERMGAVSTAYAIHARCAHAAVVAAPASQTWGPLWRARATGAECTSR